MPSSVPLAGIRAVLFDVGNTLAHLDYDFLAERMRAFAPNLRADDVGRADALVRRYGWPRRPGAGGDGLPTAFFAGYVGAICERAGLDPGAGREVAAAAEREHRGRGSGLWNRIDPEATQVLETLAAAGFRLAVVSNADGRVEDQLRGFGLRPHFEVVVDSSLAGVAKPAARIFHLALERMGVAPGGAAYIGDILDVDVRGAEGAGLHGILYDRWGVWPDARVPRVTRLGELPGILGAPG